MTKLNHERRNRYDAIWNTEPRSQAIDWGTTRKADENTPSVSVQLGRIPQRDL